MSPAAAARRILAKTTTTTTTTTGGDANDDEVWKLYSIATNFEDEILTYLLQTQPKEISPWLKRVLAPGDYEKLKDWPWDMRQTFLPSAQDWVR